MKQIRISINGTEYQVTEHSNLAAVLMDKAIANRRSVTGEPRMAVCGMGSCGECRVTINQQAHQLACLLQCCDGMEVDCEP
ncbi:MAG TPA: hypothetical protein DEF47_16110 [Herpetosiphon sp.]|uniref:Sarcosine oxidase alpha subunit n=1 Tax=Herpetosiphon aurantiacus (strain ATCC 23779 / DSM 785 / 114-95) TaxID=316274 RepID=A9AZJ5_HERA2|nr:2Fe-2S iron-sulfur cluster-binding protein [Herpetosiphon sp.]ABX05139.1 sarcosine oxidase alpha subunit [Herpetosiphon aurantiacus DSM 785]HBW51419.1 hypothetical protein [Herpetosiphon sp.]